jgi:hypothetical protein
MAGKDCLISIDFLRDKFEYIDGALIRKSTNKKIGYSAAKGYIRAKVKCKHYMLHRLIFAWHYGYFPEQVDHIDCNKTNNLIENLREASKFENSWNRHKGSKNTSGTKGIDFFKPRGKWRARCMANGKSIFVGYFDSIELASEAIKSARSNIHGRFAND